MKTKFHYLHEWVEEKDPKGVEENAFYKLLPSDISEAEKRLGYVFPSELKEFYKEIGYGFLVTKHGSEKRCSYSNRIIDPGSIADILLEGVNSGQLHPETEFLEGEMPFFEIADSASFLIMYPQSDKPNAVYNMLGQMIEESFSKFIWRLYYESPTFYLED
jgi:hypothetical protein